jgi:Major tropism determinant N-terminal domain
MQIEIAKIKIRRGTDTQRKSTVLDQGEIAFTLDTKRLYVGNGVLNGGVPASNKIFSPLTNTYSLTSTPSEVGDFGVANNAFYQLTASDYTNINSWANVSHKIDQRQLEYSTANAITIKLSSLSASNIDPVTIGDGLKIDDGILQSSFNTKSLEISANRLSLKGSGIDEREISSTTFTNGLTGGSGNKVGIRFDPQSFYLSAGVFSLSSTGSVKGVDGVSLIDTGGIASMNNGFVSSTMELARSSSDQYGRLVYQESSIFDTLTGSSSLNSSNSLSAIFNGTPTHTLSGGIPGLTITKFEAISSNGVSTTTLTLSSAGFLTFEGGYPTRSGKLVGRFAIPIFAY